MISVAEACQFGTRALAGESSVLSLAERRIWTACTHDMKACVQGQKVETISLLPEYEAFSRMYYIELHGSARRTWGSAKAMAMRRSYRIPREEIIFGRTGPSLVQKVSSPQEQGRNGRERRANGCLVEDAVTRVKTRVGKFPGTLQPKRRMGNRNLVLAAFRLLLYPCEVSVVQHGS